MSMGLEHCVWIVPGDERRVLVRNVWKLAQVRDMCRCCGELIEVDDPHLCTDCCQGRGGDDAVAPG